jgi:hypothetical protein
MAQDIIIKTVDIGFLITIGGSNYFKDSVEGVLMFIGERLLEAKQ